MKLTFEEVVVILHSICLSNVRFYLFLTIFNAQNVKYMTGLIRVRSLISLTNI